MKNRITTGWTCYRLAYLLIGVFLLIQTSLEGEWPGILIGTWLSLMGIFGLGCASGTCTTKSCSPIRDSKNHLN